VIGVTLLLAFVGVFFSMLLTLWRLVKGPDAPDRIVALDTLYINTIALVMLVGIHLRSNIFFEAALLIAMMGFVGTVTLCKHVKGRSVIE
jgi:multicomponent K+:H+ antiporter subunit F